MLSVSYTCNGKRISFTTKAIKTDTFNSRTHLMIQHLQNPRSVAIASRSSEEQITHLLSLNSIAIEYNPRIVFCFRDQYFSPGFELKWASLNTTRNTSKISYTSFTYVRVHSDDVGGVIRLDRSIRHS